MSNANLAKQWTSAREAPASPTEAQDRLWGEAFTAALRELRDGQKTEWQDRLWQLVDAAIATADAAAPSVGRYRRAQLNKRRGIATKRRKLRQRFW